MNFAKCSWFDTCYKCCGLRKMMVPWFVAFTMWNGQTLAVWYMQNMFRIGEDDNALICGVYNVNFAECSWFGTCNTCCELGKTIVPWFAAFTMWTLQSVFYSWPKPCLWLWRNLRSNGFGMSMQRRCSVDACTNFWIYAKIKSSALHWSGMLWWPFCVWWCAAFHWGMLSPHNVDGTSSVRSRA